MVTRATNDTLAKDLYVLAGQFQVIEGHVGDIHRLISEGFSRVEIKIDSLESRIRVTETEHAERNGKHSAIGWLADGLKLMLAAIAGAFGGHLFK